MLSALIQVVVLSIAGIVLLLSGMLPLGTPHNCSSSDLDVPDEPRPNRTGNGATNTGNNLAYQQLRNLTSKNSATSASGLGTPAYDRVVLIVIDALRTDFLRRMPYSTRHGLALTSRVHPPTVTLPRLKALVSGTVPGFVDVIRNFKSTALVEDNLVSKLAAQGRRLVLYGDETWLRLFPDPDGRVWRRTDPTTSFYVADYTEVDANVTRHVRGMFGGGAEAAQWDLAVLHYLGLDHIGHLAGPRVRSWDPSWTKWMRLCVEFIRLRRCNILGAIP